MTTATAGTTTNTLATTMTTTTTATTITTCDPTPPNATPPIPTTSPISIQDATTRTGASTPRVRIRMSLFQTVVSNNGKTTIMIDC